MKVGEELGIRNLHSVFGRGLRGETLAKGCHLASTVGRLGEAGVRIVVDLRTADHNDRLEVKCRECGIDYRHIPVDAHATPSEDMLGDLPELFRILDGDGFYISCQQGRHRTDIALALYYFFHNDSQVPLMHGHREVKSDGTVSLRCDDIMRRVNSLRTFYPIDETTFAARRKAFLSVNRSGDVGED